ncbi:MAG: zinc ribbon domain-containing protein [Clostridia bacterium]|nr:hypothetical protein [Anaerotignum sp.]NCC16860.1 zinc ribbon domain-containing protein [Clostridia bacterium]
MSRKCNQCGQDVGEKDVYCINCGNLLEQRGKKSETDAEQSTSQNGVLYTPLSLGDYMFIGLILMIPLVNIVVLLLWAFDKHGNLNRKNLAKAGLIYIGIGTVLTIILGFGMLQAVKLDQESYPEQRFYEYQMEDPDYDGWMETPYTTEET